MHHTLAHCNIFLRKAPLRADPGFKPLGCWPRPGGRPPSEPLAIPRSRQHRLYHVAPHQRFAGPSQAPGTHPSRNAWASDSALCGPGDAKEQLIHTALHLACGSPYELGVPCISRTLRACLLQNPHLGPKNAPPRNTGHPSPRSTTSIRGRRLFLY